MSMLDLFRLEVERQSEALTGGLLKLERVPAAPEQLEACMRSAHSLKGAARIVGVGAAVSVAHALEDCFVAVQSGRVALDGEHVDMLLEGVDLIRRVAGTPEERMDEWSAGLRPQIDAYLDTLSAALVDVASPDRRREVAEERRTQSERQRSFAGEGPERALRVSAQSLNLLVGLAAESLVESGRLKPLASSLLRLKRRQHAVAETFDELRDLLSPAAAGAPVARALEDVRRGLLEIQELFAERLVELEAYELRASSLTRRLYDHALACRMRPLAEGVAALPRMLRDLCRALGKTARLELVGDQTLLDRDILERLEAPLGHLLRNAIDHGVEPAAERVAAGKSAEAVVVLEAKHSAGMLQITVSDDGRGVDLPALRARVVERGLTEADTAAKLSDAELLEFLFLPRLSTKDAVTEISGRGVGLDVVKDMVERVGGTITATTRSGRGTRVQLVLPLSLSVVRTLLVEVDGEPYALPLAHIVRTVKLKPEDIESLEGRQVFDFDGRPIGLVSAHQLLRAGEPPRTGGDLSVVIVGEAGNTYGIVTDRFLGEREVVVQSLDARLGKIQDVAAAALMEDGSPVLVIDMSDLIRSIETLVSTGTLQPAGQREMSPRKRKRILVVDDSLTVRELERQLLGNAGYDVETAVNGMDGWNAVRTVHFDLVITDVDMPRLDGIELVTLMKRDARVRALPVIVVSYKDRAEDQRRGLEAGADYFLSKGSFHDDTLLQAVVDLIGGGPT